MQEPAHPLKLPQATPAHDGKQGTTHPEPLWQVPQTVGVPQATPSHTEEQGSMDWRQPAVDAMSAATMKRILTVIPFP